MQYSTFTLYFFLLAQHAILCCFIKIELKNKSLGENCHIKSCSIMNACHARYKAGNERILHFIFINCLDRFIHSLLELDSNGVGNVLLVLIPVY